MRYQQPQGGPLILDASNQLARGAIATTFTPGTPCVGSAPAIIPVYTGGAVYQALGQKGAGAKVANVNGRYISLGTDAQYQSSSFTHLVVAQCNSADFSSSPTILMSNYATNGSVQWRVESTGDLGLVQASQVFIGQSSGKTLAVGTPYCMALASNGGNITRFSIDGGFYGISGTGTSASFNFGNLVLGTKDSTGTERGAWDFYLHIYWPRQLTDTELQIATNNPWALFKTPQRMIYPASVGGATNFSVAVTEGADTLASNVSVIVASSSAVTEGADVLAGNISVIVGATSATTEGADILSGAVSPIVSASSATTDGADVMAASVDTGTVTISMSVAVTDGDDSCTSFIDSGTSSTKIGGDDVPREEYWEVRKSKKKRDESLETTIRAAFKKATGQETLQEVVKVIAKEIKEEAIDLVALKAKQDELDELDDEEALLLLL